MLPELTDEERERYQWQSWTPGFDEQAQRRLKASTVLISRCGGVGGIVALELAAAGIGRLILAHGGELRRNDLNRQLLMTTDHIGLPRVDSAARRLRELNPNVEIITHDTHITDDNANDLVASADLIVSAAPLFEERLRMNHAAVRQRKPIIHAAMHDLEASVLVTQPGSTACLACLAPEPPEWWTREFPVFGAVAGTAGCIAAMEAIKLLTCLGETLAGHLAVIDFRTMRLRKLAVAKDPQCAVCGK